MWFLDSIWGEELHDRAKIIGECDNAGDEDHNPDLCDVCEGYEEEMEGERCILDNDGNTTAMYIYEIDGEYLLGVNGAGWDFYNGVWDKLYDVLGLQWHQDEKDGCTVPGCVDGAKDGGYCKVHTV